MSIKKHIPNLITLANLFCGLLAIKVGFSEQYYLAGFFVILGGEKIIISRKFTKI